MNKFKLNRNIEAVLLIGTIAVTTVVCGETDASKLTIVETIHKTQDFDLLNEDDKLVVVSKSFL